MRRGSGAVLLGVEQRGPTTPRVILPGRPPAAEQRGSFATSSARSGGPPCFAAWWPSVKILAIFDWGHFCRGSGVVPARIRPELQRSNCLPVLGRSPRNWLVTLPSVCPAAEASAAVPCSAPPPPPSLYLTPSFPTRRGSCACMAVMTADLMQLLLRAERRRRREAGQPTGAARAHGHRLVRGHHGV